MTPKRKQRLTFIVILVTGFATATALALFAFQKNLLYFYSPSQIESENISADQIFRLGGLVVAGSVTRH